MFGKNLNQIFLVIANVFLVFFLIILSNLHVLPLQIEDFVFFALLTLALALYRPGWAFLFFVGTIMLENINLAPLELGIAIRPYQFFGGITILALIIKSLTKRLNFKLTKLTWSDYLVILMGLASFLSAANATVKGASFKQAIVLSSFIGLYFLARNFLQTSADIKKIIPFFLSSSMVIMIYGIWQNVRFAHGMSNFEVMAGRPNATFTEADWLGIFLVLLVAVAYALVYFLRSDGGNTDSSPISNFKFQISNQISITKFQIIQTFLWLLLVLIFTSLILTVSRSAWLGATAVTCVFLFSVWTQLKIQPRRWQWKQAFELSGGIIFTIIISLASVYFFHLTTFQLDNRAQSTGSGLQKITVSCLEKQNLGTQTWNTELLAEAGCRHINLEEIESEKKAGNFVTEVYRIDPNVSVRGEIYKKSWQLIKANPILGIGWGNISSYLGTDERGAGLNASNIFLEIWLGAGIAGLLLFLTTWLFIFIKSVRNFFLAPEGEKALPLFILLGWFALTIPNLFNSGILLGFLWLFLGIAFIRNEK